MSETLSERIARQRKLREALKNVETVAADWRPLREAERRIRENDFPTNIDLDGNEIFE